MHNPLYRHQPEPDEPYRFFCTVPTFNQVPLLAKPHLAAAVIAQLKATTAAIHPNHQLWGYVVLPESVQFVLEVEAERDYHLYVETFKEASTLSLTQQILEHMEQDEDLIDSITFFNPAWNAPVYQIWQAGYHTQLLESPYAVSNKVADLIFKPVMLGLVSHPADWPYSSYQP